MRGRNAKFVVGTTIVGNVRRDCKFEQKPLRNATEKEVPTSSLLSGEVEGSRSLALPCPARPRTLARFLARLSVVSSPLSPERHVLSRCNRRSAMLRSSEWLREGVRGLQSREPRGKVTTVLILLFWRRSAPRTCRRRRRGAPRSADGGDKAGATHFYWRLPFFPSGRPELRESVSDEIRPSARATVGGWGEGRG